METDLVENIMIAIVIGAASGAIGSFILLKRMALVGDALSHVALPGIALALAYRIDPFWGVLVSLVIAACAVWFFEQRTQLPSEALVGLLFTASLAIGILTISDVEIIESLFGEFPALSPVTFVFVIGAGVALTILTLLFARSFLFSIVSLELSLVEGARGPTSQLSLWLIFAAVVALGIKLVGTLLMGALTMIPASIAKNINVSAKSYMMTSAILGSIIAGVGIFVSAQFSWLPGPTIILLGIGVFAISLLWTKK